MNEFIKQAQDFLTKTDTQIKILFLGQYKNEEWQDKVPRNKYQVVLSKGTAKNIDLTFWDSINNTQTGKKPTAYDILSCLQKYDVGTFEDFCITFGYDKDSRRVKRIYHAAQKEYIMLCSIFTEEQMEQLREVQ